MDMLCTNPLKFIIFIDDLTFTEDDADFSSLKAMLEGSVSSRAKNTVIYATSNRRHMIKETFSARAGDELHRNDTIQELTSLSERFGLHITYSKPNQALFLRIVKELCTKEGINMPEKEIEIKAEAYALRKSGRSARAARQFVDYLHTQI
jgi:predicted AAA+ superfamily ATPase